MGEAVINITATDNDGVCILLPFDWLKINTLKKNQKKKFCFQDEISNVCFIGNLF